MDQYELFDAMVGKKGSNGHFIGEDSELKLNETKTKKLNKQGAIWVDETHINTSFCTIFVRKPEKEFQIYFRINDFFIGVNVYHEIMSTRKTAKIIEENIDLLIFLLKEIYQDNSIRLKLLTKPIISELACEFVLKKAVDQLQREDTITLNLETETFL